MIQKLKQLVMPKTHKEYFNAYVSYFPTIDKQLKLGRNGSILVTNKINGEVENYKNWEELNKVYQLFPISEEVKKPIKKYWVKGNPSRYKEIIQFFSKEYNLTLSGFNKNGWVYYINSKNELVSTSNENVIELLQNSNDWVEYQLPAPIKYTKEQIAEMLGKNVGEFEIIN